MIHPQYILGIIDSGSANFSIEKWHGEYIFRFSIYYIEPKILYKIKKRFQSGKVIQLSDNLWSLNIKKRFDVLLQFFIKNKLLNIKQRIKFIRFYYLYQKLIIEKDTTKLRKEQQKINKRLKYFNL